MEWDFAAILNWKRLSKGIIMVAIKTHFDGNKIVVPKDFRGAPAGDVIVIFESVSPDQAEKRLWLKAQENAFARVWENDEDEIYDSL